MKTRYIEQLNMLFIGNNYNYANIYTYLLLNT